MPDRCQYSACYTYFVVVMAYSPGKPFATSKLLSSLLSGTFSIFVLLASIKSRNPSLNESQAIQVVGGQVSKPLMPPQHHLGSSVNFLKSAAPLVTHMLLPCLAIFIPSN